MFEDVFVLFQAAKNPFCLVFIFSKQLLLNFRDVEILNAVLNTVGRRLVFFLNGTFYNLPSGVLFSLFFQGSAKFGEQAKGKMQLFSLAPQRKRKKDRLIAG